MSFDAFSQVRMADRASGESFESAHRFASYLGASGYFRRDFPRPTNIS
jgi:hypothetical protein